jgi:hypothetical protein
VSPYLRTVKTSSGATAVQIVHSSHRGSRDIEHLGSAHTAAEVELLKAAARQKLAAGQGELDLGLQAGVPGGLLPITASRMGCLLDALAHAYDVLGFTAAGGDEAFFQLVAARIIEPVSKPGSLRVLEEAGLVPVPYRTVTRRLRVFAREAWRQLISAACAAHARLGPASLVLYDCPALYSRQMPVTGSARAGSPKSAGWSRRSPSACSPARTGSRSWSAPSRATRPRPGRCCRSSGPSWPRTSCRTSDDTAAVDSR